MRKSQGYRTFRGMEIVLYHDISTLPVPKATHRLFRRAPTQGYVAWMDNVVLLKDAPNRENALKFLDFLLVPENAAAVSNFARYAGGVEGVSELLDESLRTLPEANPPASAGPAVFIEVCDEQTQAVYDQIWTNVKK